MPTYHQRLTTSYKGQICAEGVFLQRSTDKATLIQDNRDRFYRSRTKAVYSNGDTTIYSGGGDYQHRYYIEEDK